MSDLGDFKRRVHDPAMERLHALDRAAGSYRAALRAIVEKCGHDRPDVDRIREIAEQGIRAADHELSGRSLS